MATQIRQGSGESAVTFDTRALAPGQGFASWATGMPYYDVSTPDPDTFEALIRAWSLAPILVVDAKMSAVTVGRDAARIAADGRDEIVLLLLERGTAQGAADGRPFRARGGQIACHDRARPLVMALTAGRNVALSMPRAFLEERVHAIDLHGLVLSGEGATLLGAAMRALPKAVGGMRNPAELARVLRDLVAATVRDADHSGGRDTAEALRARARRFIAENLDAALGVGRLCDALGVSRARLYRAFDDAGGVAHYVQERRLARIQRLLRDPAETRSIAQLAVSHGFADPAHFSRLFRKRFGVTARELRRVSRPEPAVPVSGEAAPAVFRNWEAAR